MAGNALPLLLVAGFAVALGSKKKKKKGSGRKVHGFDEFAIGDMDEEPVGIGRKVVKVVKKGQVLSTMREGISDVVSWRLVEYNDTDSGSQYHAILFYDNYDQWSDGSYYIPGGIGAGDYLWFDAGRIQSVDAFGDTVYKSIKAPEHEAIAWADGIIESVRSGKYHIIGSDLWPRK